MGADSTADKPQRDLWTPFADIDLAEGSVIDALTTALQHLPSLARVGDRHLEPADGELHILPSSSG